jgi:hypothetical protein
LGTLVNLAQALEMVAPYKGLPHYDTAIAQLYVASAKGKRELGKAARRMRDAFSVYNIAITYGQEDEIPAWKFAK